MGILVKLRTRRSGARGRSGAGSRSNAGGPSDAGGLQGTAHKPSDILSANADAKRDTGFVGDAAVLLFTGVRYERQQVHNSSNKRPRTTPFSKIIANSNHKSK